MTTEVRRDQKGLKIVTGENTVREKAIVCRKRILAIVQSAEHLVTGCVVYRLSGPAIG